MPKIVRQPARPARAAKSAPKSPPKMAEKSVKAVAKRVAAPVVVEVVEEPEGTEVEEQAEPSRSWQQGGLPSRGRMNDRLMRDVTCRSCGKRPGRPTAIIGQLTATELCEVCANLRKERIRANRASQRGYRL